MRIFLVIAVLVISIKVYGQPGPFGGHFCFRFSDVNNIFFKKRSGLTVWPEFKKDTLYSNKDRDIREAKWPSREIKWIDDSTLCYELIPTPMGGHFPQGFTIAASYNNDTMRIQGFDEQEVPLSIDNIPFLKGDYNIPNELIHFLNIKWKKGMKPTSLEWRNFEVNNRYKTSYAVLERLENKTLPKSDISFQEYKVINSDPKKGIVRYDRLSKSWDTLLLNVSNYPVKVVNNNKIVMITLGYSAFLFSDRQSDNWKLVFYKEPAEVKWVKTQPFRIDSISLVDDKIFLKTKKYYFFSNNYDSFKYEDSVFQVHINLAGTNSLYQKIKAENEKEMSSKIITWLDSVASSRERSSREKLCAKYPNRLYQYLENGQFFEPEGGRLNHLLLTLNNGKFQYKGTNQRNQKYQDYANYDSKGKYLYNDSTITFYESTEYQYLTDVNFIPRGTYYWYFTDHTMILTQHKVDKLNNSYKSYNASFWVKKE